MSYLIDEEQKLVVVEHRGMRRSSPIVLPTHGSVSHRYIDITHTVGRALTLLVTYCSYRCVTDDKMRS